MYSFLLCNSNFVFKTRRFSDIRLIKLFRFLISCQMMLWLHKQTTLLNSLDNVLWYTQISWSVYAMSVGIVVGRSHLMIPHHLVASSAFEASTTVRCRFRERRAYCSDRSPLTSGLSGRWSHLMISHHLMLLSLPIIFININSISNVI